MRQARELSAVKPPGAQQDQNAANHETKFSLDSQGLLLITNPLVHSNFSVSQPGFKPCVSLQILTYSPNGRQTSCLARIFA